MSNKIEVDDRTEIEETIDEQPGQALTQDEATKQRIAELRAMGQGEEISVEEARGIPTSILIISITKFPDILQDLGVAVQMSQGDEAATSDLMQSAMVMKGGFEASCGELDARIPARDQEAFKLFNDDSKDTD